MWEIKFEKRFVQDYKRLARQYPGLADEVAAIVEELAQTGEVPSAYHPHELSNPGGNYNGHMDLHLSEGKVDIVLIYAVRQKKLVIRFVRMGTHADLFQGELK